MFNSDSQFENYIKSYDATLFVIYLDPTKQTATTYDLKADKKADNYGFPFN